MIYTDGTMDGWMDGRIVTVERKRGEERRGEERTDTWVSVYIYISVVHSGSYVR